MSVIFTILFCGFLVALDQLIKYLVVSYLMPIQYIDVIENILRFRYVENSGAIFGSFSAHTIILTVVSVVLLAVLIFFLASNKIQSKLVEICLLLMVSGGIGNIIDRIRLGYVVDFIEPLFVEFAVFNFADCLITVGAFLLVFYLMFDLFRDIKKSKSEKTTEKDNGAA